MANILLVPMRVDALVLGAERAVVGPLADFSRLPWTGEGRDHHPSVPYIGRSVVAQPFQDVSLTLAPGVHLHWRLPAALCRATAQGAFPRVPNLWLVTRRLDGAVDRWVVESDYLAAPGEGHGVSYPVDPDRSEGQPRPFRRLGRSMAYGAVSGLDQPERLERLTAVGYGEPTFAAFYPNCFSVFGFHDRAHGALIPAGLTYEVIGWYSDPSEDELHLFLDALRERERQAGGAPSPEAILDAVKTDLGWDGVGPGEPRVPDLMVCFGCVTFPNGGVPADGPAMGAEVGLAVGQTGIEALSAYAGAQIDPAYHETLEDQLVAMSMDAELAHHLVDIGPKFEEARHREGFVAIDGGVRFTVQATSTGENDAGATAEGIALPEPLGRELNETNLLQAAYDRAAAEIVSLRRQVFTDWVKYMRAAHPPAVGSGGLPSADEIRAFVQDRSIPDLAIRVGAAGLGVDLQTDDAGDVEGATAKGSSAPGSLSGRLADAINRLVAAIDEANQGAIEGGLPVWALRVGSAPRFWQPTEPVVLLTGPAVASSAPRDGDAPLRCRLVVDAPSDTIVPDDLAAIEAAIEAASPDGGVGFNTWTEEPWNPLLLEWGVEVLSTRDGGNLATPDRRYRPDFITRTYDLDEGAVDLATKPNQGAVHRGASIFTGLSILSPYANPELTASATAYLMEQDEMLEAFYAAEEVPPEDQNATWVVDNIATLQTWYEATYLAGKTDAEEAEDPVYTAIRALGFLPDLPALSQSLSGFGAALIMLDQSFELPVSDPLAFASAEPFLRAVRGVVRGVDASSPRTDVDFNPIRTGALRLLAFRLVDTFGRFLDVPPTGVCPSRPFSLDAGGALLSLPPRLSQPARLGFRFRSAASGVVETDEAPATPPICGFLQLDAIDRTIAVYDASGAALGTIRFGGGEPWAPAPGGFGVEVDAIEDATLRRVVENILDHDDAHGGAVYREGFGRALETALHQIAPNGLARAQGLATLVGRPIAVVRAFVRLEVLGTPAIHQGWIALGQDMHSDTRRDDRFPAVRFPVRIGDVHQLDDGLVGYWIEQDGGALGDVFHAPKSEPPGTPHIRTRGGAPDNLEVSLDGGAIALTLLMDPTGAVHATSGIAPVKRIGIPEDQFHEALSSLEVAFFAAPLLTLRDQVQIPLREEPGFAWSWLEQRRDGWDEVASPGVVRRLAFLDVFGEARGAAIWDELLDKGWIVPLDPEVESASVTPKDQRSTTLDPAFQPARILIQAMLLHASIGPADLRATFAGPEALREGWLKLRPLPG